jgi:hypothetical protein
MEMGLGHAPAMGETPQSRHARRQGRPLPAATHSQESTRSEERAVRRSTLVYVVAMVNVVASTIVGVVRPEPAWSVTTGAVAIAALVVAVWWYRRGDKYAA